MNMNKRKRSSDSQVNSFVNILSNKLKYNSNSYHTVIELTHKQWHRMESNSIILSDLIVDKSVKNQETTMFNNVLYSDNIKNI